MIGTTVWAKPDKPDKPPGKPSDPEPVIADYIIEIGKVDEDIILNPPNYISFEDVDGGYWLPPPIKGKSQKERVWRIGTQEVGEISCTYTIADVPASDPQYDVLSTILADHGVDGNTESPFFMIEHVHTRVPSAGVRDYWQIGIAWEVGHEPNTDSHIHGIICMTNIDAEWEGEYVETTYGTWIVTFEDAEAVLMENPDGIGDMDLLWEGTLSFTVTITRTSVYS
jgi:hypothetical protein